MSFSRRSFLAASGGLAAAATLAACGTNTGREPAGGASAVALSQWYHQYGEDGVEAAVKRYAAAYGRAAVTVKWNPGEYDKLVSAALLTDQAPDVFEYGNGPTLDMIRTGQVADLTDAIGDAKAAFNQPVLDRLTYDGKIWAIPQTVDMQLLYYRPSLLAKAGVSAPTTLAELTEAAAAVKAKAGTGGFFAGNDGGVGVLGSLLIWAAGFDQITADGTGIAFNDPAFVSAVKEFAALLTSDGMVPAASADWYDGAPFVNGEAAMQWGGLWSLPDILAAHGDDVGVLPFPAIGSAGRPAVPFGAFSACVAAASPHADAAKEFVRWLWVEQEDYQVEFSDAFGTHIPAKPALAPRATKLADGPGKDAASFVAEHGFTNALLWTPGISDAYSTMLTNVVKKSADPAKEIGAVVEKASAELDRVQR